MSKTRVQGKVLINMRAQEGAIKDLTNRSWNTYSCSVDTTGAGSIFNQVININNSYMTSKNFQYQNMKTYTISCWVKLNSSNNFFDSLLQLENAIWLTLTQGDMYNKHSNLSGRKIPCLSSSSVSVWGNKIQTIPVGSWFHIAYIKWKDDARIFINGTDVSGKAGSYSFNLVGGESATSFSNNNNSAGKGQMYLSGWFSNVYPNLSSNSKLNGYINDLVFIQNASLWTSDFTPPTTYLTDLYDIVDIDDNIMKQH